jgi:hypothetical protein
MKFLENKVFACFFVLPSHFADKKKHFPLGYRGILYFSMKRSGCQGFLAKNHPYSKKRSKSSRIFGKNHILKAERGGVFALFAKKKNRANGSFFC